MVTGAINTDAVFTSYSSHPSSSTEFASYYQWLKPSWQPFASLSSLALEWQMLQG